MSRVVTVEIAGQRYPIRSALDERYVTELAAYVDGKMRAAAESAPASDLLGLAILVALIFMGYHNYGAATFSNLLAQASAPTILVPLVICGGTITRTPLSSTAGL